jgi:hypothetical protein
VQIRSGTEVPYSNPDEPTMSYTTNGRQVLKRSSRADQAGVCGSVEFPAGSCLRHQQLTATSRTLL